MAETKMQLADWLDDLCVRFIVNLPQEELESVERICFQVEEAQWFYEDFIRPLDASLPSMSLRTFCMAVFRVCPLLCSFSAEHHLAAYSQFLGYKTRVPVRGAILLNERMDQVLLVKGWKKGASWSFPRGKINKDEKDLDCAIREVYEETGYDLANAGLVPNEDTVKSIEVTMREQHMKLYVFKDVPMDTEFQARTRKEISKITWWKLSQLPGYQKKKAKTQSAQNADDSGDSLKANKLYMVAPFLPQLKKWIAEQRRQGAHRRNVSDSYLSTGDQPVTDADVLVMEDDLPSDVPAHNLAPMAYDLSTALPQMVSNSSAGSLPHGVPVDAATQMKRLLGVSEQPATNFPQPAQSSQIPQHQMNLLNTLKQNGQASAAHNANLGLRQSGTENVIPKPALRAEPNHDGLHATVNSQTVLPVVFSHQLESLPGGAAIGARNTFPGSHGLSQQAATTSSLHHVNGPLVGHNASGGNTVPQPPFIPHVHSIPTTSPEPRLARLNQRSAPPVSSSVPSASELPTPRLNSHTMNLLNMFKGKATVNESQARSPAESNQKSRRNDVIQYMQPKADTVPIREQRNEKARSASTQLNSNSAFRGLVPSTVGASTISSKRQAPVTPSKSKETNQTQQNLLSLFKSAPLTVKQKENTKSSSPPSDVVQGPVQEKRPEQAASLLGLFKDLPGHQPSPRPEQPPNVQKFIGDYNTGQLLQLLNEPLVSRSSSKELETAKETLQVDAQQVRTPPTSVTSAQHQRARQESPRLHTAVRERDVPNQAPMRILQRPIETHTSIEPDRPASQNVFAESSLPGQQSAARRKKQASRTALQKAEQQLQPASTNPVQILKRPTSSDAGRSPLRAPHHERDALSSAQSPKANATPQKGFSPQILRRPQQHPIKPSERMSEIDPAQEDQRPSAKDVQQRTLLSLLSGSSQDSNSSAAVRMARKPISATLHSKQSASVPPSPGVKMELSRSRISSVASPPGLDPPARSRLNSNASLPRAGTPLRRSVDTTGSQTPISPADKGFLVNYLEGVIGKNGSN